MKTMMNVIESKESHQFVIPDMKKIRMYIKKNEMLN